MPDKIDSQSKHSSSNSKMPDKIDSKRKHSCSNSVPRKMCKMDEKKVFEKTCKICGQTLYSKTKNNLHSNMDRHMRLHFPLSHSKEYKTSKRRQPPVTSTPIKETSESTKARYKCGVCNKLFLQERYLQLHYMHKHSAQPNEEESTRARSTSSTCMGTQSNLGKSVLGGNHETLDQSGNICEETVHIVVASNQDVKEEIIQDVKSECFPQDNNEINIKKEDVYEEETDNSQTTESNTMKLKTENINEILSQVIEIKEECSDF
eukprot:TRINITY_DN13448_c0_g1_i1.p1 TRINITY_DN13448_c0_g1~~TRINITY_DN13448_c0_g1_i1.p1  ORF type:complete len:270 (-),score=36.96 TRINITY_DN13448_c0_g1_i1:84-869(-)